MTSVTAALPSILQPTCAGVISSFGQPSTRMRCLQPASLLSRIQFGSARKLSNQFVVINPNERKFIVRKHNVRCTDRLQLDGFPRIASAMSFCRLRFAANEGLIDGRIRFRKSQFDNVVFPSLTTMTFSQASGLDTHAPFRSAATALPTALELFGLEAFA